MTDKILDELKRLRAEVEDMLRSPMEASRKPRGRVILTKDEIKSWKRGEPSYRRPIFRHEDEHRNQRELSDEDLTERD